MNTKDVGRRLAQIAIPLWAAGMTFIVACLMVGHWVNLPHPEVGDQMVVAATQTGAEAAQPGWKALHFLYGDCPCSRRVLKRVVDRTPLPGVAERIVFIGEDLQMELQAREQGFEVDCVTAEQLQAKYGVESAPLLVVVDSTGAIKYSGGYTSRKQGLDVQDEALIANTVSGRAVEDLPLYGCAVSKGLKAIVDPLGIK